MDSLLPSEIARLVLGYLEEEKFDNLARSFLEMSPHLDECRTVASNGGRFSTKVNGFTLVDILDKFCAANATVQERLSKVADCEQLKHCGDLSEQLRFLVDGSRGQRFVVNINVPTSQTSAGSPIISSSVRKRHHSGSERERSKRAQKSHSQSWGKTSDPLSGQLGCDAVETTPLEHLPGHSGSEKSDNNLRISSEKCRKERSVDCCSSTVIESIGGQSLPEVRRSPSLHEIKIPQTNVDNPNGKISPAKLMNTHEKCSTGTDTEELMRFTNTEVQTTPYDVVESETELMDEPVENLSLLTKELLNRTELQERIAENINKAILPADMSFRETSLSESLGGEINTSIMTELNNAIKSVVTATESDPVFAKFLDEIIGPHAENDTSPDEDGVDHQPLDTLFSNISPDLIGKNNTPELPPPEEKKLPPQPETPEIPLKNRLRSSTNQQIIKPEEDRLSTRKLVEKEENALEDLNAAAILSIINANNKLEDEKRNSDLVDAAKGTIDLTETVETTNIPTSFPNIQLTSNNVQANVPTENTKISRKANVRKPRAKSKPKPPPVIPENVISEEEIMAMPTLIVCSKEEMSAFIGVPPVFPKPHLASGYCASQFLPIAPKTNERPPPEPEPLYLRTVNVATKVQKPDVNKRPTIDIPLTQSREEQCHQPIVNEKISLSSVLDLAIGATDVKAQEKITLYGNENSNITVLDEAILPTVSVDEPVSVSGTGLSPFLKFNNNKTIDSAKRKSTEPVDASVPMEMESKQGETAATASTSKQESYEMLTKRTPRSLLKSRSKNHRLSLSTPRRRSNHIRALDFNTPTKGMNSNRRMSINDNGLQFSPKTCNFAKKVCRTSLFKSPPFAGSPSTPNNKKMKNSGPVKDCRTCKVPIATRSPAPKLMGGWEKYTGVGIILGSTSPSSSSSSPVKNTTTTLPTVKKSWDADLRESLKIAEEVPKVTKKVPPKKAQSVKRRPRKKDIDEGSRDFEPPATVSKTHDITTSPKECTDEKSHATKITAADLTDKGKLTTKNVSKENPEENTCKVVEKCSEEVVSSVVTATNNIVKTSENDKKKKKYVQLKTITSNVTNLEGRESATEILHNAVEKKEKNVEFVGNYSESSQRLMQLPNMLDLETPRKLENKFGIPPTPRLLSPSSSSSIMPFGLGHGEESVKVLQTFIPTPEFPSTPCIAVTPKQISDNTVEDPNKEFACTNYYQPSSELKDPRLPKLQNDQSRHDMSLPLPGIIVTKTETHISNISAQVAEGFQASTTSGKLEITQFEVIKENLPRDQTLKELNISTSTSETKIINEATVNPMEVDNSSPSVNIQPPIIEETKNVDQNCSIVDDDSSDSDSSCSSDSSSDSSSSSSSSSSSATNTSANITLNKQHAKKTPNKIYTDTSNDNSIQKLAASVPTAKILAKNSILEDNNVKNMLVASRVENESSPKKVFAIIKTDEALDACNTETPAKDESLLAEANISETPSSSKAGFDNVTNLTSKISAFITTEETKRNKMAETKKTAIAQTMRKALPKIISVQRILPDVSIALKPTTSNDLCNAVQNKSNSGQQFNALSNAKLSKQLEEKRLRLMAKFKEKDKPPAYKPRIKRTVPLAKAKKPTDMDENVTEEITNGRNEEKEDVKVVVENPKNDEEMEKQAADNKSERYTKSQMLKELFDESCSTLTPIKVEHNEIPKEQKKEDDFKTKCRSRSVSQESTKSRASDKITEGFSSKLDENISEELLEKNNPQNSREAVTQDGKIPKNDKKEDCTETISINTVESNKLSKSKVDLVKRDLFSDEESSDQRTTRSRTRQTCDMPKNDCIEPEISVSSVASEKDSSSDRKKDLPGVLECLDLVPTVKNDTTDDDLNVAEVSQSHAEYLFIYDDSVPTKRRRRKFSSSELEFSVEVELTDEDYKMCSKVMTATAYEEIFNLSPPRKRRGTTKESVKTLKHNKKDATPRSNVKTLFNDIQDKPLATSSPVVKTAAIKIPSKTVKSPAVKIQSQPTETKKKLAENEKHNPKSRKRKTSTSKESEQVEKKPRSATVTTTANTATTANPQLLLSKLDLDEFLTTVHGPA